MVFANRKLLSKPIPTMSYICTAVLHTFTHAMRASHIRFASSSTSICISHKICESEKNNSVGTEAAGTAAATLSIYAQNVSPMAGVFLHTYVDVLSWAKCQNDDGISREPRICWPLHRSHFIPLKYSYAKPQMYIWDMFMM